MSRERDLLLGQIEGLKQLAAETPPGLTRQSFEVRIADLEAELDELTTAAQRSPAWIRLLFGGGPVHGNRSIDADFAAIAMSAVEEATRKQHIARHSDRPMKTTGRLSESDAQLEITRVVRGRSVGFEFTRSTDQLLLPTMSLDDPVQGTLTSVAELLEVLCGSNEGAFERLLETIDTRVWKTITTLVKAMDSRDATVEIEIADRRIQLGRSSVRVGAKRARSSSKVRMKRTFRGLLSGVLPDKGLFEFTPSLNLETNEPARLAPMTGAISAELSEDDRLAMSGWTPATVDAVIATERTTDPKGRVKERHTLIRASQSVEHPDSP